MKFADLLEEFIEYTPILVKEDRRMSPCNRLDLQTTRMPKNLPEKMGVNILNLVQLTFKSSEVKVL